MPEDSGGSPQTKTVTSGTALDKVIKSEAEWREKLTPEQP